MTIGCSYHTDTAVKDDTLIYKPYKYKLTPNNNIDFNQSYHTIDKQVMHVQPEILARISFADYWRHYMYNYKQH